MESAGFFAAVIVGAVLVMAGSAKAFRVDELRESLERYEFLPEWAVRPLAGLLPAAEIGIGTCLIFGILPIESAVISAVLLIAFVVAQGSALKRKLPVACTCFGILYVEPIGTTTIGRDVVLVGLAFTAAASAANGGLLEVGWAGAPSRVVSLAIGSSALVGSALIGFKARSPSDTLALHAEPEHA